MPFTCLQDSYQQHTSRKGGRIQKVVAKNPFSHFILHLSQSWESGSTSGHWITVSPERAAQLPIPTAKISEHSILAFSASGNPAWFPICLLQPLHTQTAQQQLAHVTCQHKILSMYKSSTAHVTVSPQQDSDFTSEGLLTSENFTFNHTTNLSSRDSAKALPFLQPLHYLRLQSTLKAFVKFKLQNCTIHLAHKTTWKYFN